MQAWSAEAGRPPGSQYRREPQDTQQLDDRNNEPLTGRSQAPAYADPFEQMRLGYNRPYVSRRGPVLRPAPDDPSNDENVVEEQSSDNVAQRDTSNGMSGEDALDGPTAEITVQSMAPNDEEDDTYEDDAVDETIEELRNFVSSQAPLLAEEQVNWKAVENSIQMADNLLATHNVRKHPPTTELEHQATLVKMAIVICKAVTENQQASVSRHQKIWKGHEADIRSQQAALQAQRTADEAASKQNNLQAEVLHEKARSLHEAGETRHKADEQTVGQLQAALERKKQKLASERRRLREHEALMDQMNPELASLNSKISKQAAQLNANATRIAELEATVEAKSAEIESLRETQADEMTAAETKWREREIMISDLETKIIEKDEQLMKKLQEEINKARATPTWGYNPFRGVDYSTRRPASLLQPSLSAQPKNCPCTPPSHPAKKPRTHSPDVSEVNDAAEMRETTHVRQTAERPRAVHAAEMEQRADTNQATEEVEQVIDLRDAKSSSSSEIESEERRGPVSQRSVPSQTRRIFSPRSAGARSQSTQKRAGSSFTMPSSATSPFDHRAGGQGAPQSSAMRNEGVNRIRDGQREVDSSSSRAPLAQMASEQPYRHGASYGYSLPSPQESQPRMQSLPLHTPTANPQRGGAYPSQVPQTLQSFWPSRPAQMSSATPAMSTDMAREGLPTASQPEPEATIPAQGMSNATTWRSVVQVPSTTEQSEPPPSPPQAKRKQPPPKKPVSRTVKAAGAPAYQVTDLWPRIDFLDTSAPGGRRSGEELSESLKAELAPGFAAFCKSDKHWRHLTAKPQQVQATCSQQRVHSQTTTETQLQTCDFCISRGLPCVHSTKEHRPLMVPLPEHERSGLALGDVGYWIRQSQSG